MKINEIKSEEYIGNPFGVIVPFSVVGVCDGGFEYDVYDRYAALLAGEMDEMISDYLTENFFRRINLLLSREVDSLGYEPDRKLTHSFILQYRPEGKCDEGKILPSTQCVTDISAYTDLTDAEFECDEFPVFATVQGGTIVSACGVNGFVGEDTVEIAVETVDAHRGKGYARSNVCAAVNYLLSRGYEVAYQCYPDNEGSVALAASCGLTLYSRDYYFVCYEKED